MAQTNEERYDGFPNLTSLIARMADRIVDIQTVTRHETRGLITLNDGHGFIKVDEATEQISYVCPDNENKNFTCHESFFVEYFPTATD